MEQLAYEDAADMLARALDLLDLGGAADPRRPAGAPDVARGGADGERPVPAARETFEQAVEIARELGDTEAFANAALGISRLTEIGYADEKIIAVVEEALEAIPDGDSALRAQLLRALGAEYLWIDAEGRADELARESLDMARRVGDDETLAAALHARVITQLAPGTSDERLKIIDELQETAERMNDREFALRAHAFRLREMIEQGEIAAADRELEAYAKIAEELRMPAHLWHVPMFRAMRALIAGELDKVEDYANEARVGGERAGEPLAAQLFAVQIGQLRRLQGRIGELLPVMREMTERYPALPAWRTVLATALSQVGRIEEAKVEFDRLAARDFADVPRDGQFRPACAQLGEVCVAVGDSSRAELLYEWLLPSKDEIIVIARAGMSAGSYSRILGLLAATLGRREDAEQHFIEALAVLERMGDRPMSAWTRIDYASVLLGVVGAAAEHEVEVSAEDRERALEIVGDAIETGREIGAAGLVERGLAIRLDAQGLSGVDITTSIDDVIEAVESEKPDLRAHAAPDGTVTILFSDIEDSTILTERLGDERWLEVLREHNSIFREQITAHDGYEVKNQGDGFMLAFPDACEALECAIEVQRAFAVRAAEGAEDAMRIRMGLHAGEVIAEEGDFFGKNVILAARIAGKALGGEILVSSTLKDKASDSDNGGIELRFDAGRELELKGLAGKHKVFRAEWESQVSAA